MIGGRQTPLMKMMLDEGLLHGGCMTVTGKTLAENLKKVKPYPKGQEVVRPFSNPIKPESHLVVLYGNLAPKGAVAKISGKEGLSFTGKAFVFENEQDAMAAILDGRVRKGHVIVIRHEGPVGGPGMRGDALPHQRRDGKGLWAKMWRSSPMAASPAALMDSSSATSRRRPLSAGRWPS